jgi:hypothetical protein
MQRAMFRRMEDKIRRLCSELLAATGDSEQIRKLGELRRELHLHIEQLRARLATYPVAQERRVLNGIPPPDVASQNAVEPTLPINTVVITSAKTNMSQAPDHKNSQDRRRAR